MRRFTTSVVVLLVAGSALTNPTALADETRISDPNDTNSHLDIRSATMGHDGEDRLQAVITTFEWMSGPSALDPANGVVGFAFDTDGDLSDLERLLFMFMRRGHLEGMITNGTGRRDLAGAEVSMPDPRKIVASFSPSDLRKNLKGYSWFAFASSNIGPDCCLDTAPNRKWVLHDIAPPSVDSLDIGNLPGQSTPSSQVTANFVVDDMGGSGLERWEVKYRINGTSDWHIGQDGTGTGSVTASFTGQQGSTYDVCIRAEDRSANVSDRAFTFVQIPIDDTSSSFSYDPSWSLQTSDPNDFMGTRHVTSTVGATIDIQVPANVPVALVVPGGLDGRAWVTTDDGSGTYLVLSNFVVPRSIHLFADARPQPMTLHVVVDAGTFAIDGLLAAPAQQPPPVGERRCP